MPATKPLSSYEQLDALYDYLKAEFPHVVRDPVARAMLFRLQTAQIEELEEKTEIVDEFRENFERQVERANKSERRVRSFSQN